MALWNDYGNLFQPDKTCNHYFSILSASIDSSSLALRIENIKASSHVPRGAQQMLGFANPPVNQVINR